MQNQLSTHMSSELTGSYGAISKTEFSRKAYFNRYKKFRELSKLNQKRGKLANAQRCLEKAIEIAVKFGGRNHSSVLNDLEALGYLLMKQGKNDASRALLLRTQRAKMGQ